MPLDSAELASYRAAMEAELTDTLDVVRTAGPGFVAIVPGAPSESVAHANVKCAVDSIPATRAGEVTIAGGTRVQATHVVLVPVGTDINPATDSLRWGTHRLMVGLLSDRTNALLDSYTCSEVR